MEIKVVGSTLNPTNFSEFADIAHRAGYVLDVAREKMLEPNPRKAAPTFSLAQIASLCQIEKSRANYILANHPNTVPAGCIIGGNRKREFTLAEARQWIAAYGNYGSKPRGGRAFSIAIGNFKGGVSKTTTCMALAQGLSLRGRKVLVIDLDSQGSLTQMNDYIPIKEVSESDTILPLIYGDHDNIEYAIKKTYWDGIDIVPATPSISHADFYLPSMQTKVKDFEFWNVLNKGIESVRDKYDAIIFDTPPALSYITSNAFFAADGLIVPMQPEALSFASSTQFWSLFDDLTRGITSVKPEFANRHYQFTNILITMASTHNSTKNISEWIRHAYGDMVLPISVPESEAVKKSSTFFGTVYDLSSSAKSQTISRVREAYDALAEHVDTQIMEVWKGAGNE